MKNETKMNIVKKLVREAKRRSWREFGKELNDSFETITDNFGIKYDVCKKLKERNKRN